jgi:hypothetical protein
MHSMGYRGRKWKWNRILSRFWPLFFLCLIVRVISGCDGNVMKDIADDDSYDARIEAALIALDDANYTQARSMLLILRDDFPDDPTVLQYLSSAYAGLAGLDTFDLLETIDQLSDRGQEHEGDIDTIGLVLGDADGVISRTTIADDINNLNSAIESLEAINNPTDDHIVQLGLLSLARAALTIADVIAEDTGNSEVTLTEDGIAGLYETDTPDFTEEATTERLENIGEDIVRVGAAVVALDSMTTAGSENDLSENFNGFQQELDPDDDDDITQQELEDYINGL